MRRRVQSVASGSAATSSATDTEWSDAEDRAVHRAVLFKKKVDDGAAACARGDFISALQLYEEAIRLDPTNHVLFTNRSAIFCKLARYEQALADAEKSFALNPGWTKAYYRKGYALKSMGQNVPALIAYASGLVHDSKNCQLLAGLIECMLQCDMKDRFTHVYNELKYLGLDKSPFVMVSVVGQEVLNAGHTVDAINILECALRIGTTSLKLRQSVLSALSTAYYNIGDWTKAKRFMDEDLSIAVSLGDSSSEARAQGNLGMLSLAVNNLNDALGHYQRQMNIFMQIDANFRAATALSMIGQIHRRQFRYEDSLSSHEQCLDLLQDHCRLDDHSETVISLLRCQQYGYIGDAHLALGRLEESERYFADHLDHARCNGFGSEEIKALSELGSVNQACSRWEDSMKHYSAALHVAKEEKNRTAEASLCCSLSTVYEAKGGLDAARKWADRALALALSVQDQHTEAKACGHLATVEMKMGMLENAKKLFRRQLDMAAKLGDAALTMKAYRGLGVCHCSAERGSLTDAVRCHKTELSLAQHLSDKVSEATAHGYLGLAYTKLRDCESARSHFLRQLALAKETKRSKLEMMAMKHLGFHYSSDNFYEEESSIELAVEYFEKYLMLAQESNDSDAEQSACTNLGRTHFCLGRYKESARYFDQSLSLAKDLRDHRAMANAYCDLGKIRSALSEFDEALECQKYFLALAHILSDTELKLTALSNIGDVLLKSGKANVAAKVFAKQLSLARASKRKKYEALSYGQLGKTYEAVWKTEKAMALFLQELALYEELEDVDGQYEAHGHISEHYQNQGQVEPALKALDKQLQLARRVGHLKKEADLYKRMGELCAKWNLLPEAVEYFDSRRALLLNRTPVNATSGTRTAPAGEEASLDYARCLLAAGDDVGAARALDELFQLAQPADSHLPTPEIGLLHRDQGWCWLRLGNYGKAAEAFETALDYLERGVVDAGVKCDCYRALAAAEFATGGLRSALTYLNRRVQFVRTVGFLTEEPRSLCDLAYVLIRGGDATKAEEVVRAAIALVNGSEDEDSEGLGFRTRMLLAMIRNDCGEQAEKFAIECGRNDYIVTALVLRASSILPSSPAAAGKLIGRAMEMISGLDDLRLAAYVKILSALRYWSASSVSECKDELLDALRLLETAKQTNGEREQSLFDEALFSCCIELCLILTFVFFASHKLDEEAIAMAEKLRFRQFERCFRSSGVRFATPEGSNEKAQLEQSLTSQLKAKLRELKRTVLYFAQVEDILFSWILSGGFLMSAAHRIPDTAENDCDGLVSPVLPALRLRWPFHQSPLTEYVKRLIVQTCFNNREPSISQPSHVVSQSVTTALAHDNSPPIIVGCDRAIAYPSISDQEAVSFPVHQLSFLPFEAKNASCKTADCTRGVIINAGTGRRSFNFGQAEVLDARTIPKSAILPKFNQYHWIHLMANCSKEGDGLVLNSGSGNDDGLLTVEDILDLSIDASVITISVQQWGGTSCSDQAWNRLMDLASAFIVCGVGTVIVAWDGQDTFFERFYNAVNSGSAVTEALDGALQAASTGSKPELILVRKGDETKGGGRKQHGTAAALRMLLRTPEECREALRVMLHLVEKALQRISAGLTNPMFTSEQSVRNKAGPEVGGCIEFLTAVGFERGLAKGGHLPSNDALYFPLNDDSGLLARGSGVIQALLGLPQTALFAFSKLASTEHIGSCVDVLSLIGALGQELALSAAVQLEWTVSTYLWGVPGLAELLAALGFDKMAQTGEEVTVKTIRMELTRKKVAFSITALKAIFEDSLARSHCNGSLTGVAPAAFSSRKNSSTNNAYGKRRSSRRFRHRDSESADLSGLESDFSAADLPVLSMASLMKRTRNDSTTGSGFGRKRGKRGSTRKGKGGYLSEGDVCGRTEGGVGRSSSGKDPRGYCSEEDDRRIDLETSNTAQVISVDERCSPVFTDDELTVVDISGPMGNGKAHHEYASLETPVPSTSMRYVNDRMERSSPRNFSPTVFQRQPSPVAKLPPPYQAVFPNSSIRMSCQDLSAPAAVRKAMEKLAAAGLQEMQPPAYEYAMRWKSQTPSPPRVPPPYSMHSRGVRPAGRLAGY